jgi:hypothetical protein
MCFVRRRDRSFREGLLLRLQYEKYVGKHNGIKATQLTTLQVTPIKSQEAIISNYVSFFIQQQPSN